MSFVMMARGRGGRVEGGGPPPPSGDAGTAAAIFSDDFSSGNFSATGGGCSWGEVLESNRQLSTRGIPLSPSGSDRGIQFFYGTGIGDNVARFILPSSGLSELWLRYYLYYPVGGETGVDAPEGLDVMERSASGNNKFIRFFDTTNGSPGGSLTSFGASTQNGAGVGGLADHVYLEAGRSPAGGGSYSSPGDLTTSGDFTINDVSQRGTWNKVEWHIKMPTFETTTGNTADGIIRMYYNNAVALETTTGTQAAVGVLMKSGYLMGYNNAAYNNAGTLLFLADFAVGVEGRIADPA